MIFGGLYLSIFTLQGIKQFEKVFNSFRITLITYVNRNNVFMKNNCFTNEQRSEKSGSASYTLILQVPVLSVSLEVCWTFVFASALNLFLFCSIYIKKFSLTQICSRSILKTFQISVDIQL